ncbi:Gfo/Idh/MocA family protein [Gaetbulibacter saemankumensis]|uniref:Gfo/Idh/MocA family protein n=1 Tax=Gaetbulibacter saemankumensis TaxID=311208 RepID=UPI00041010A4|nr:Gfo/Idh/MocA family oxidoreductase [Gaetbulibacter saemankumensis]
MTKDHKNRRIKWGIIGLGNIAHKFATDLLTIEDAELYAVASRSAKKASEFANQYEAKKYYNNYSEFAKDSGIDAVYIATPHAMHKENTLMCLKNGIAVLCEKPFAMNREEVNEMITIAKQNNVLLMEALWTYFLPHYQYILNLLKNEIYGKVTTLNANFGFFREYDTSSRLFNKSLGGGSLLDIGIYPIFAALSTLGLPKHIEADATYFENGTDASCDMIFTSNNSTAHLRSSLLEDLSTEAIFQCDSATLKINTQFHAPTTVSIIQNGKEENIDFNYNTIGYNFEVIHFNKLLRDGHTESDIMTFKFSQNLINTLDTVREIINLKY